MSPRRASERDSVAVEVGNFHPKDHLAERRLVRRALHEGLVQPGTENQQDEADATAQETKSNMGNATHHSSCQPEATENHAHGSHHNPQDDGVNDGRNYSNPKPTVASSHHRRNRSIRSCWG